MSGDEAALRALIEDRLAAMRDKDGARLVASLAPDVVAFELVGGLEAPPAQARDAGAAQAWLDGFEGPVEAEARALSIHVCGDVAFAHSLNRLRAVRKDGVVGDFWMRLTLGFGKRDGAWAIVHAHTSVPFRSDGSFTAAMNLQP